MENQPVINPPHLVTSYSFYRVLYTRMKFNSSSQTLNFHANKASKDLVYSAGKINLETIRLFNNENCNMPHYLPD